MTKRYHEIKNATMSKPFAILGYTLDYYYFVPIRFMKSYYMNIVWINLPKSSQGYQVW